MTKKRIITASTTAALLLASATLAFAQTTSTATTATTAATPATTTQVPTLTPKDAKNTVQIGPKGNALIRGTVNAVGTNSITVNSWGGLWTVVIDSSTEIIPKSTTTPLGAIKQGDFVGVNGKIDTAQAWTVNARVVRDTDAQQRMIMTQKQMRMQMKDAQEKMRQNIQQIKKTGREEIKDLRQKQEEERKKLRGQ